MTVKPSVYMTVWVADPNRVVHRRLIRFRTVKHCTSKTFMIYPVDLFVRLQPIFDGLHLDLDCDLWDVRFLSLNRDLNDYPQGKRGKPVPTRPSVKQLGDCYKGIGGSLFTMSETKFQNTMRALGRARLRKLVLYVRYKGPKGKGFDACDSKESEDDRMERVAKLLMSRHGKDVVENSPVAKRDKNEMTGAQFNGRGTGLKDEGVAGTGRSKGSKHEVGKHDMAEHTPKEARTEKRYDTAVADYVDAEIRKRSKAKAEKAKAKAKKAIEQRID